MNDEDIDRMVTEALGREWSREEYLRRKAVGDKCCDCELCFWD